MLKVAVACCLAFRATNGFADDFLHTELDSNVVALVEYRGYEVSSVAPTVGGIIEVRAFRPRLRLRVVANQRGDLAEGTLVVAELPQRVATTGLVFGDEGGVYQPGELGLTRPPWDRPSPRVLEMGDRFVVYLETIPPRERFEADHRVTDWVRVKPQRLCVEDNNGQLTTEHGRTQ